MSELNVESVGRPLLPLPEMGFTIRPGTAEDLPFIDYLQKKNNKQVGFFPTKALEGKLRLGHVLVATRGDGALAVGDADAEGDDEGPALRGDRRLGYLIGNDQYFKRDDVGCIFQINVARGSRRRLVAAHLLRAQFARSAYGCKLYCCWCAQDIEANGFWESMGFVALAYRVGSELKGPKDADGNRTPRVHIFWQKRIRAGDESTPWWFPSKTTGGAIGEDRVVLPIPRDAHWRDARPLILPESPAEARALPAARLATKKQSVVEPPAVVRRNGLAFAIPQPGEKVVAPKREKPAKAERVKRKCDPRLASAARELRDRWLEQLNETPLLPSRGKYEVARAIDARATIELIAPATTRPLLAA